MQAQTTPVQKPKSKMFNCIQFYRKHVTKELLTAKSEEAKQALKLANKLCRTHFVETIGLTSAGANTYLTACRDVVLGNDPHAGRKLANKNSRLAKKSTVDQTAEVVAEIPAVDLTKRWAVGASKTELVNSFDTRSQAQQFAKDNGLKWFDSKVA